MVLQVGDAHRPPLLIDNRIKKKLKEIESCGIVVYQVMGVDPAIPRDLSK